MSRKYRPHKRRRSQAVTLVEEPGEQDGANDEQDADSGEPMEVDISDSSQPAAGSVQDQMAEQPAEPDEELKRKQEIWEAFQEEHHEVLEQLPLSLQRSYSLIAELDEQVTNYNAQILATLKEYVALRKTLAAIPEPPAEPPSETMDVDSVPAYTNGAAGSQEHSRQDASPAVPNSTRSTRELLTSVAQLADETVRSSREKLNIARFTCGLIDRYMRDLDRAIKEQEASISIGMREGTHPAKIVLPEVVPPGPRAPKPYHTSVVEELEDEELLDEPIEPPPESPAPEPEPEEVPAVPEPPPPAPPPPPPIRKTRSKSKSKKTHKSKSRTPHEQQLVFSEPPRDVNPDEGIPEKSTAPHRPTIRLTFSLPPAPSALPPPPVEEPVQPLQEMDPNENSDDKLYCICNGPSDGMMLACDNTACEREWYHFECLGITRIPKGTWLCPDCKEAKKGLPHRKKARRRQR